MPNTAETLRQCTRCGAVLPVTEANFFHRRRNNGALWIDTRCQPCRRTVDRENRRRRAAGNPVRPRRSITSTRKFGIEIEYIGDSSPVAREMVARGLRCAREGYNHQVRGGWKIVPDGSISGGFELVSPPLSGDAGFREVELACEALEAAGARINRSCGLHVHHDANDLDAPALGRLFRGWFLNQGNVDWLVAASRRGSQWARPLAAREVRAADTATDLKGRADHFAGRTAATV
jgi:predicted RNA-binding Zn-ribbon protein involved in translation (DUF1610 family)